MVCVESASLLYPRLKVLVAVPFAFISTLLPSAVPPVPLVVVLGHGFLPRSQSIPGSSARSGASPEAPRQWLSERAFRLF